jgi:glycosyltransferase involved in cell wall biosynthesis
MRICLISREYPPDTGWGGIATFARHLAQGLKEIGHEVEVVSLAANEAYVGNDNGIPVHRVTPFSMPGELASVAMAMPYSRYVLRATCALWRKFSELHSNKPFDVVDTPELLAEGVFAAVTKAVPTVIRLYTPHSKFMAEQLHNVSASFDHQFVAMLERLAMVSADAITSPSDDLAEFVANDLNYPIEKISIIRNPIDPNDFSPDGPKAIENDGRKLVLFVGRLEERKGITYLVNAIPRILSQCPNTRFVIIGDDTNNASNGQRSVLTELKELLKKFGVQNSVTFIPRVALTELPAYYRSADICVVPSVYDNSPYTCLEAMSCGKAVVGTAAGGTPEYLGAGHSGIIVPPKDPQAIAEAVVQLLQDDNLRNKYGMAARERVLQKFQRTKIAEAMVGLYQEAIYAFSSSSKKLYLKSEDQALLDAAVLLFSFDKMIYDLLYQYSWRMRLQHWLRLGNVRPRLLLAKGLLRLSRLIWNPAKSSKVVSPNFVQWLEHEVKTKQDDPLAKLMATSSSHKLSR